MDIAAQTPPLINAIIPSDEWILTNKERVGDPPDVSLISPEQQVLTTIAAVLFSAGSQKYEVTAKIKFVRSGLMNMIVEQNPLDSFDMTTRRTPVNWYREQGSRPAYPQSNEMGQAEPGSGCPVHHARGEQVCQTASTIDHSRRGPL